MKLSTYIFFLTFIIISLSCSKNSDNLPITKVEPETTGKQKNIILMIGDGMGLAQISAARTVNGGHLHMLSGKTVGVQSTHAADKYVTDSGASATAMSCGQKTNYYSVGVDVDGNPLENIVDIIQKKHLQTGLVTTSSITHATPAAFYAHQVDRFQYEAIALELVNTKIDFFAGGGRQRFNQRTDGINLLDSLTADGYKVCQELNEVDLNKKNAVFIADGHPVRFSEGRGDFLPQATSKALEFLGKSEEGFFLMIEGAQIDWACEENNQAYLLDEMLDFDKAVGIALNFAKNDGNTVVVVTGDHETGGYALLDGDVFGQTVDGQFLTFMHTGTMVPVFSFGVGEEMFSGMYENTAFFTKFLDFYNLTK